MSSHSYCGWCKATLIVFFVFSLAAGPPVVGQNQNSSLCHIEVSVTLPSPQTLSEGAILNLIVTADHRAPCAIVTLSESNLPRFASGWDGKVDTCGWCSVIDTVLLQPSYGDAGEYSFKFIAASTWGCGLVDTLVYILTVLETCQGPFVLPEPPFTKGLSNTIYWIPAEGAYYQSVCAFDSLNPDSVFGCLELKGKIACETHSTTFENLQDGHCYGYYVNAIFIAGPDTSQIQSNIEYSTQDNSAPDTVKNIWALADSGGIIAVRWDTVSDAVSYVDSYCVYRKEDGETPEFLICLPADSNEYRDSLDSGSGLVEGETYYFLVRAVDAVGNMGEGVLSNAVVPDSTPPCKPVLCWYEGCGYDYQFAYHYYKGGVENTICMKDMNARPECQGVKLAHWVRFQAARDSLKYFEDEFMPGIIFFDSGWLPYDSLLNDTLFYDSQCPICRHFDFAKVIQDVSFVHRHQYLYRVQTKDSPGNISSWSNIRGAVQDAYPPGDISNLFAYAVLNPDTMSGYMDVRWDPAEDLSGIRFYKVYRKIGVADTFAFIADIPGNQTQYIDSFPGASGIDSSTTVCYRIGSIDNVGNERGKRDTQWEACDRCPLGPSIEIVNFGYTDSLGNKYTSQNTASVCWYGYDNEGVVGYKVVVTGIVDTILYQNDPSAECFSIPLPADGEYFVKVQALFTGSEASTWSNPDSIIRHTVPPTPGNLWVWNAPDSNDWSGNIYLCWGPDTTSPVAVWYEIYRDGSFVDITSDTCWVDTTTLVVYQCYEYYVCAVDSLDLRGCSPDTGPDYCNRPPTIVRDTYNSGMITICWTRAQPNLSNDFNAVVGICEDSLENLIDTGWVFNKTCYTFQEPQSGHNYIFRVIEYPKDLGSPPCSDESLHSAWSEPCVVPYNNLPDTVDNLVLQPQPYPCDSLHTRPLKQSGLTFGPRKGHNNLLEPCGCIFLSWEGYTDSLVTHFLVLRWLHTDDVDTLTPVEFPCCTLMNDGCWADSVYKFTVIAVDSFGQHSVGNDTDSVAIHPPWVFTPKIKPFKPRYFCSDSLTVWWGWVDLVDGDTVWVDTTTFGAESCWVQISIDSNFVYHVTESGWMPAKLESIRFPLPDYVNDNNNVIYSRIKAKDRWNHSSPWSTDYFGLPDPLIYDCVPPEPVKGLTLRTSAHPSREANLIGVTLTWPSVDDRPQQANSGMCNYIILRDSANVGWEQIHTVAYPETSWTDSSLNVSGITDSVYKYTVRSVDSVGNKQPIGNDSASLKIVCPPKIDSVYEFLVCLIDTCPWREAEYLLEGVLDDSSCLGYSPPCHRSPWIDSTCYNFDLEWQSGHVHYVHAKARTRYGNESAWSEVKQYPPKATWIVNTFEPPIPTQYLLSQNVPNPFNPNTYIEYGLPKDSQVKVEIYNLLGQRVRTLVDKRQRAGYYRVCWGGVNQRGEVVTSGIYFYRITAGDFNCIKKMILSR